jgi:hypothetical protein
MIPTWIIQLCTMLSAGVGFGFGWITRGQRDRELALEERRKRGIDPEDLT